MMPTKEQLLRRPVITISLAVGVCAIFLALISLLLVEKKHPQEEVTIVSKKAFLAPEIEAEAAYVFDAKTGEVLFASNAEQQLPLASITKLMTALVAVETIPHDKEIAISPRAIQVEGDSGLTINEPWNLQNLLSYTLLVSSNDGAAAVALATSDGNKELSETTFVEKMNQKATSLGLAQTYFLNPTGLDVARTQGGAFGSARDVSQLMAHIVRTQPSLLEVTRLEEAPINSEIAPHSGKNTNASVGAFPGLIGSKTGFTDLAGGNLVVALDFGLNHPIIVTVLGSSEEGRFSDAQALANAAFAYLQN